MSLSADIMQAVAETCGLDELDALDSVQVSALIAKLEGIERARVPSMTADVRAGLRYGAVRAGAVREKYADIDPRDAVQHVLVHAMWFDAPDAEIADALAVSVDLVRTERAALDGSARVRQMVAHARTVAAETGFSGRPGDLVTLALAEYAARHRSPVEARSASGGPSPRTQAGARHSAPARGGNQDVERTVVLGNDGGAPLARGSAGRSAVSGLLKRRADGSVGDEPSTRSRAEQRSLPLDACGANA